MTSPHRTRRRRRAVRRVAAVLFGVVLVPGPVSGCQVEPASTSGDPPPRTGKRAGAGAQPAVEGRAEPGEQVRTTLSEAVAALPVARERRTGYDRDLFEHWVDSDANGCDTRDEVLLTENRSPDARLDADAPGCDLLDGLWRSYYDRVVTEDDSEFDVDHLVPLAEAWDSGAAAWSPARRRAYANDVGERRSLVGVSASSNRGMADDDPSQWLPTYGTCVYVSSWTAVKVRWSLSVDRREKQALAALTDPAAGCGERRLTVTVARVVDGPDGVRTADERASLRDRYLDTPPTGAVPRARPSTCAEANAAGLGPFVAGRDRRYAWFDDADGDGVVCER